MIFNLVIALCLLALTAAAQFSAGPAKISSTLRDLHVNGAEGLNLNIVAPFKFQDYVLGFRYAVGNFKKLPEALFASKSFETFGEGHVTVDADFNVDDKVLNLDAEWQSDKLGLAVAISGDNVNTLKTVAVSKDLPLNDKKVTLSSSYDALKKKISGKARLSIPKTVVDLAFDSDSQDPTLIVSRAIDENNEVIPSIGMRSGSMSYGFRRRWEGGSLLSTFYPGKKVLFNWKDEGVSGNWITTADVPIGDTKNTKITVTREWKY